MKLSKFREEVTWGEARLDEEAGVIRHVKILGEHSSNHRRYTKEAMAGATKLYEGMGVNLNHRFDGNHQVGDAFGRIVNVVFESSGLWGDLQYLKSHPYAPVFVELAKRMPEQVGLSHMAEGKAKQEGLDLVVEEIKRVRSVDIVRYPATTRGLFESADLTDEERQLAELRETVLGLVNDETLSLTELKEALMAEAEDKAAQEKAAAEKAAAEKAAAEKAAADAATQKAAESQQETTAKLAESVNEMRASLDRVSQQVTLLEACNAHGVVLTRLSEQQATDLRGKKTREEIDAFLTSLPEAAKNNFKPAMPTKATPSSYDEIRNRLAATR
jgi:hypothetical protein